MLALSARHSIKLTHRFRLLSWATVGACCNPVNLGGGNRLKLTLLPRLRSVGKTSLMNQFVNSRFNSQYKATIGADL